MMEKGNIFSNVPKSLPEELFTDILSSGHCRIERIVSRGHTTPDDQWYDQNQNEWVMLIKGKAKLRFDQNERVIELGEGEYINIPAHVRHRVEWTDPEKETIWLAVFY